MKEIIFYDAILYPRVYSEVDVLFHPLCIEWDAGDVVSFDRIVWGVHDRGRQWVAEPVVRKKAMSGVRGVRRWMSRAPCG